jgi:hypothetical protein
MRRRLVSRVHESAIASASLCPSAPVPQVRGELVRAAQLPTAITFCMEQNLANFEDCLGGCERILRTPIPLAYARQACLLPSIFEYILRILRMPISLAYARQAGLLARCFLRLVPVWLHFLPG